MTYPIEAKIYVEGVKVCINIVQDGYHVCIHMVNKNLIGNHWSDFNETWYMCVQGLEPIFSSLEPSAQVST